MPKTGGAETEFAGGSCPITALSVVGGVAYWATRCADGTAHVLGKGETTSAPARELAFSPSSRVTALAVSGGAVFLASVTDTVARLSVASGNRVTVVTETPYEASEPLPLAASDAELAWGLNGGQASIDVYTLASLRDAPEGAMPARSVIADGAVYALAFDGPTLWFEEEDRTRVLYDDDGFPIDGQAPRILAVKPGEKRGRTIASAAEVPRVFAAASDAFFGGRDGTFVKVVKAGGARPKHVADLGDPMTVLGGVAVDASDLFWL